MEGYNKMKYVNINQTIMLNIDLRLLGQTSTKNRPYMVISTNRQMTWLVPLTTVLKGAHGRIKVINKQYRDQRDVICEAITTDLFSISTDLIKEQGKPHGEILGGATVRDQLKYSIDSGTLGKYA